MSVPTAGRKIKHISDDHPSTAVFHTLLKEHDVFRPVGDEAHYTVRDRAAGFERLKKYNSATSFSGKTSFRLKRGPYRPAVGDYQIFRRVVRLKIGPHRVIRGEKIVYLRNIAGIRVSYCDRAVGSTRRLHRPLQRVEAGRREYPELRYAEKERNIENAVMRRTVAEAQPRSVHKHRYRQLLKCNVVYEIVIASLQKRRIYGKIRSHAVRRKPGGEGQRVFLGNSHIKKPFRDRTAEALKPGSRRHCRSDCADAPVGFRHSGKDITGFKREVSLPLLSGGTDTVIFSGVLLGWGVAFALHGLYVNNRALPRRLCLT